MPQKQRKIDRGTKTKRVLSQMITIFQCEIELKSNFWFQEKNTKLKSEKIMWIHVHNEINIIILQRLCGYYFIVNLNIFIKIDLNER